MRRWSGGQVYKGLIDNYPLPPKDPTVTVTPQDARRWLGIELTPQEIGDLLARLEFQIEIDGEQVRATTPDHRLDIGEGIIGMADLMEEVARIYGYENIPETRMADELPPQLGNPGLEKEERVRDLLVGMGMQEVITYRMTDPEREARRLAPGTPPVDRAYISIANPIASDRRVLRQSLLSSMLEVIERNSRLRERIAIFEIAPIFLASEEGELPDEVTRLVIALTGPRALPAWQGSDASSMDFYDLKGILDGLFEDLHLTAATYQPVDNPSYHPGKSARVLIEDRQIGVIGELHPQVRGNYELPESPLLAADLDLEAILTNIPSRYDIVPVPAYPPVLEDLAVIVDEKLPAEKVAEQIQAGGGAILTDLRLFDVYRGEQIGAGKKSLAYSLTYQDPKRTLTDKEVAKVRNRIIKRLEDELGAGIRSA
jgi:phenylalanyl-tRNA synthetase beta chain